MNDRYDDLEILDGSFVNFICTVAGLLMSASLTSTRLLKAPNFGEDELFSHLSSVFSPVSQEPVSFGHFLRSTPRWDIEFGENFANY